MIGVGCGEMAGVGCGLGGLCWVGLVWTDLGQYTMAQSKSGVLLASEDRGLAVKPAHSVPSWRAASGYWAISAHVQLMRWSDQYGSHYSRQCPTKANFRFTSTLEVPWAM